MGVARLIANQINHPRRGSHPFNSTVAATVSILLQARHSADSSIMKKFFSITLMLLVCASAFGVPRNQRPGLLREFQLNDRVAKSDLIVEGKVVSKQSFWNTDQTMIYTAKRV
jgi:hypothetical protein